MLNERIVSHSISLKEKKQGRKEIIAWGSALEGDDVALSLTLETCAEGQPCWQKQQESERREQIGGAGNDPVRLVPWCRPAGSTRGVLS